MELLHGKEGHDALWSPPSSASGSLLSPTACMHATILHLFFSFSSFELFSFYFFSFYFLNFSIFFSFLFYRFFNRKIIYFSTIAITTNATKYFFYLFFLCLFLLFCFLFLSFFFFISLSLCNPWYLFIYSQVHNTYLKINYLFICSQFRMSHAQCILCEMILFFLYANLFSMCIYVYKNKFTMQMHLFSCKIICM